jgi:outer membrane murein-binding lipoprotein Lpp
VPWWTWVALGFFVAVILAGGVVALVAFRALGALQATGEQLTVALEELAAKSEQLERSSERAAERLEAAEPHFEHLRATLDRFSVLTWALGDVAKTVGEVRNAVLVRK